MAVSTTYMLGRWNAVTQLANRLLAPSGRRLGLTKSWKQIYEMELGYASIFVCM